MSFGFNHSDPVAEVAVGKVAKQQRKQAKLSQSELQEGYVDFAVKSVIREKPEHRLDALMKRLGTFAASDEFSDTEVRDFCRRIEEGTNGRWDRAYLYNAYVRFSAYFAKGGPSGANNFITPLIAKINSSIA